MAGSIWQMKLLTSWWPGSKEKEQEGAGVPISTLRANSQLTNFLLLNSTA
jgi:hypothetical protein